MVERWIKQKALVISDCASLMSGGRRTISFYNDVHVLDANNGHTWMTILGCVYNLTAILSATQECSLNKTTFHGVRWDSEPNLCWNGFHIEICQQGALQWTPKVPHKKTQIIFLAINSFVHEQKNDMQKKKKKKWGRMTDRRFKGQIQVRAAMSPFILRFWSWFSVLEEAQMSQGGLSVQMRLHEQDMSPLWMKWSAQIGNEIVRPDFLQRCHALLNAQYWQSDQTLKRWPLVDLLVRTKRRFLIPIQTKFWRGEKKNKSAKEEDVLPLPEGSIVLCFKKKTFGKYEFYWTSTKQSRPLDSAEMLCSCLHANTVIFLEIVSGAWALYCRWALLCSC